MDISILKLAIFSILLFISLKLTDAATCTITSNSDIVNNSDNVLSLREAIQLTNTSSGPDTILFSADLTGQTIQLSGGQLTISDAVRIEANNITIDARQASRIFNITDGNSANKSIIYLSGITITRGSIDGFLVGGGGIINYENLTLRNCSIVQNSVGVMADGGAGIRNSGGDLSLIHCTIANNSSSGTALQLGGGGILNSDAGVLTIDSSVISGNSATSFGGGIHLWDGIAHISNSTISGNTLTTNGKGGGLNNTNGWAYLYNVKILQNVSNDISGPGSGFGGGIFNEYYTQLINCTVDANVAYSYQDQIVYGGGIYNHSTIYIVGSTISNNRAIKYHTAGSAYCGGFYNAGPGTIVNSTVYGNIGRDSYGGIMNTGTLNMNNCTVTGNNDLSNHYGGVVSARGTLNLANSVIANSTGGPDLAIVMNGILNLSGANIVEDGRTAGTMALDPKLGPLQDNGGFANTCDLLPGSPAFNAGSNSAIMADTFDLDNDGNITEPCPFDQRGNGFLRVKNTSVDLGAIEHETPPVPGIPTLASPVNSTGNLQTGLSLSWNAASGATSYQLQLSTSSTFNTTVVDDSIISTTSRAVNSLSPVTTYFWRVRAKNDGGASAWSDVWSFSTAPALPGIPTLSTPVNASTDQPTSLILSWNAVSGAASFRLQLSSFSDFSTLLVDDSTLTGNSKAIGSLINATKYYWRANAKNAGGTSVWSEVRSFTTVPNIPSAPILSAPVNAAVDQPISLTLSWNAVQGAASYRVQISNAADFGSLIADDSTLTTTSKAINSLINSTTYFWRVNAKNGGGTSTWSEIRSLTTVLPTAGVPTLSTPVNAAIDQPISLTLSWNAVSGATSYSVHISNAADFSSFIADDSMLTTTLKTINSLLNGVTYYWRVNAKNGVGTSAWSEVRSFRTVPATAGIPTLSTPVNAAIDQPISLTLSWNAVPDAVSYRVQISNSADFSTLIADDSTLTMTSKAISSLINATTYYWRVNAKNNGGTSAWSEVRSLTTVPPTAGVPILFTPVNAAINQPISLTLSWDAVPGAAFYRVQISNAADFSALIADDSTLTSTTKTINPLINATAYYWRVNAKNSGGTSAWSEIRSFTTLPALPELVVLVTPSSDGTISTDSVFLVWQKSSNSVDRYKIEVFSDSALTILHSTDSLATDTMYVCRTLQNHKAYWWRVSAHNTAGWGIAGQVRKFTVEILSTAIIPKSFVKIGGISGVNGNIRYGLPLNSRVTIKIFDFRGKLVKTLMNSEQRAGFHSVSIRDAGLANGKYLLAFCAADYHKTKMFSVFNH